MYSRSLEEIKRDNARLNSEREVKEDFSRMDTERRNASRENFNLKHGGKVRVVKNVGRGFGKTAGYVGKGLVSGLSAMGNQYAKANASKQPQKRKRRVKKVSKKRKSSGQSFTISYN